MFKKGNNVAYTIKSLRPKYADRIEIDVIPEKMEVLDVNGILINE